MDPFNIIVRSAQEQLDLNIHPQETGTYKIIYHGALLGEIFRSSDSGNWEAVTAAQMQPGGFPVYDYDETSGHEYILQNEAVIQEIGRQIASNQNLE